MSAIVNRGRLTIGRLRAELARVDGPAFRTELAQVCGEAAGKFVNDGFRTSSDPYGTPWEPIHNRRGKPLLDTGRLRASFEVVPIAGGFRVDATASYAPYHQYGASLRQRRPRFQPIGKNGRFISRRRTAKRGAVPVRFLPGGAGGVIPARPMVPTPDQGGLPIKWQRQFGREARDLVTRTVRP